MLEYLGDKTKATEEDASLAIAQLVETLAYLHKQNIVHLDIRVRQESQADLGLYVKGIGGTDFKRNSRYKNL